MIIYSSKIFKQLIFQSRNSQGRISAFLSFLFLILFSLNAMAQPSTEEQLAVQYYQESAFDKAEPLFDKLYQKTPNNYFYNYYLNTLIALTNFSKAEVFVKSVMKKFPNEIKYEVDLAYVYSASGETKKSNKLIEKKIKSLPQNRQDYVDLAMALRSRDFYDFAIDLLKNGQFDPPLNTELADLYYAKGDYNNMIATYLDLIHSQDIYIDLVKGKFQIIMSDFSSDKISAALREELLKRTEKYPTKTIYAELLYWYSVQKREYALALIQAKALDRQFSEQGERVFQLANILVSNKEYTRAIDGYNYILALGSNNRFYQMADINLLNARFKSITSGEEISIENLNTLVADYQKAIDKYGENRSTLDLIRNLAQIHAYWLHQTDKAEALLDKALNTKGLSKEDIGSIKLELGDILLFEGKKWSASLLFKQVEKDFKNDPLGFEAKYKAAKFFYYVGEMDWAKIQLDVLKGATSKLIANDAMELSLLISENIDDDSTYTSLSYYSRADLLAYQQKYDEAFLVLDTIDNIFPGYSVLPNVAYKRAEIYKSQNKFDSAAVFYEKVLNNFPYSSIADNALYELAVLYDDVFKNKVKAQEYYEKILLEYPGSLFTVESRKRFNELKQRIN